MNKEIERIKRELPVGLLCFMDGWITQAWFCPYLHMPKDWNRLDWVKFIKQCRIYCKSKNINMNWVDADCKLYAENYDD
jgi:hypothetical protein